MKLSWKTFQGKEVIKYEKLREGTGIHTAEKENFKCPFPFFGGLFFTVYSALIISADQKYYGIFLEFVLPPLLFLSSVYAMSGYILNEKESALQNEVEEARWLLDEYEVNSCNTSVNALIDFYRSRTEERGWGNLKKMCLRNFSDVDEFRNAINEIVKRSEQGADGRKCFQKQENISDKELFISEKSKKGSDEI